MYSCSSARTSHKDPTELSPVNSSPTMHEKSRGVREMGRGRKQAMKTECSPGYCFRGFNCTTGEEDVAALCEFRTSHRESQNIVLYIETLSQKKSKTKQRKKQQNPNTVI